MVAQLFRDFVTTPVWGRISNLTARSLFFLLCFAHVEHAAIGGWLLCLQRSELWPCYKKAPPHSPFHSSSVSTLVLSELTWQVPNHPASSNARQAPCWAYSNRLYYRAEKGPRPLVYVDSTKTLADKRPHGATRRQCSQSGCAGGTAMWHEALNAHSHLVLCCICLFV